MDIKLLQKALLCGTIPILNRKIGLNFKLSKDIHEAKQELLEKCCLENGLKICNTVEEQISSIIDKPIPYTNEQKELISIAHRYDQVVTILEYEPIESEIVEESKIIEESETELELVAEEIQNSESDESVMSESVISERELKMNLGLKKLIDKIAMCPDFSSLFELKEDFEEVGMEIKKSTNDKVMLCFVQEESEEKQRKLRIFEDYILIGSEKDPHRELTNRFVECLTKFVKLSLNRNKVIPVEPKKSWTQTRVSTYGDAIGMVMENNVS